MCRKVAKMSTATLEKIKDFTDLITWQKGHALVLAIYSSTSNFPEEERYSLTSQMRRAVVSVTSSIAEGFSRATAKDQTNFYVMAMGSLTELQNQLLIAKDVGYLEINVFDELGAQTLATQKLLAGLIKSSRDGNGVYTYV